MADRMSSVDSEVPIAAHDRISCEIESHRRTTLNMTDQEDKPKISRRDSIGLLMDGVRGVGLSPQTKRFAIKAAAAASLGGLHAGYDLGSTAAVLLKIAKDFDLGTSGEEVFTAVLGAGMVCGALISGVIVDRVGRRDAILGNDVVLLVGTALVTTAWSLEALLVGRFVIGVGIALALVADTLYLMEVSPIEWRGALASCNELMIAVGVLLAFSCGAFLDNWRVILGMPAIFAIIQIIVMRLLPRSPRWLVQRQRMDEAADSLAAIFPNERERQDRLRAIIKDIMLSNGSYRDLIQCYWPELSTVVGIAMLGQLIGNAPLMAYSPIIFEKAGLTGSLRRNAIVYVGVAKMVATVFAVIKVDTIGRKMIMVVGVFGCALSLTGLAISIYDQSPFLAVFSCIAYVLFWSPSFGTVTLLLPAEIFPTALRGQAMAIVTPLGCLCAMVANWTFLSIFEALGPTTFEVLSGICIFTFIFVLVAMPETAGREIQEIYAAFHTRSIFRYFGCKQPDVEQDEDFSAAS